MSEHDAHPALSGYDIDDEYIDVEPQRSAINIDEEQRDTPPDKREVCKPNNVAGEQSVDMSHVFGRMQGDGSQTFGDLQIDARKATERDDRGGETGMDVSDAGGYYSEKIIRDGKQRTRAEWLLLLNNGYRSQSRKQDNQTADNERWIDTFTAQLELTDYQISEVRRIIKSIDMSKFGTYTVEIIVLAAISMVTQQDDRMVRDERKYKKLLVAANGDFRDIRRVRNLIKEKSPLFDVE